MTKKLRNAGPLLWLILGWTLAALYILGPRAALNRGLDKIYSVSRSVGRLV